MGLESRAERRDGLIATSDARASISERQVRRRLEQELWRPVRRGVVAVNGSPRTWRQEVRAVVLACDGRVMVSHPSAIRLMDVEMPPHRFGEGIHVSGSLTSSVRLDGVVFHRSGCFLPADTTVRDGIACTSPLRTVIDCSGGMTPGDLGQLVDQLLRRKMMRLDDLRQRVASLRPAPGRSVATLRKVLAARIPGYDPGESTLESRLALLIAAGRIVPPQQQYRVAMPSGRYRLDFAWPDRKIFLEGNGFGAHSLASDLDRDARRQNALVIDGWRPIELTWRMTDTEIIATLAAFGLAQP